VFRHLKTLAAVLIGVALVGVLAAAGCSPNRSAGIGSFTGGAANAVHKGGVLTYYVGDVSYIDPYNVQESEGMQIDQSLFDSLTAFDSLHPDKVVPAAAESWEATQSGRVWTFHLNKNDYFADGTPVHAQDFIFAWNRIASTKTKNTSTNQPDPSFLSFHLAPIVGTNEMGNCDTGISGLKAVDDYTLRVTLKYSFADFAYVVAHPALAPVPQKYVDGGVDYKGKKVPFGEMPVGNGPFKMSAPWKRNQYVKVVANRDYYGKKAYIDGVNFMFFKNQDTAYTEFEAGNLDVTDIPVGKIKDAVAKYGSSGNGYTANPAKQVLWGAEAGTYFLVCNLNDPVMKNPNLRRAVSLAINRRAICDLALEGTRDPADNVVPPGIAGYQRGAWALSRYDQAAAKAALAAAGYPDGKGAPTIALTFNNDGGHEKTMQLVQSDLRAIGLKVTFDVADGSATLEKYEAGSFQIGVAPWTADYPIMDNFLFPLFKSGGGSNLSKYDNASVDAALQAARSTTNQAARIAKYQELDRSIGADLPVIPIMFFKHNQVVSSRVHDMTSSAMNLTDFASVWLSKQSGL
jgi:peptide/nickel transport system substrate-binding protein/oligopeptide transport system substrate-binding protein